MSEEKTSFKESRLYPIVFMAIITSFFVGILAVFYHSTKQKVTNYQINVFHTAILNSFNLPTDHVIKDYETYITEKTLNKTKQTYYIAKKDSLVLGFAYIIHGKGLWGSIEALVSLKPDLNTIINAQVINQSETPGLGARISEDWFLSQFINKNIKINEQTNPFTIVSENEKGITNTEIRGVTGATLSTTSFINMIKNEIPIINDQLRDNHE